MVSLQTQARCRPCSIGPYLKPSKLYEGFLGLTGYCHRFVTIYGRIARPLTRQLKKDAFIWNEEATQAFKQLKEIMISLPVLALLDFSKAFIVETNASGIGLGAVLMQDEKPLAYFSHNLSRQAYDKLVYKRELMQMVVLVIRKWRPYLLGR